MKLNNIFHEPLRKIIETVVGTAVLASIIGITALVTYELAKYLIVGKIQVLAFSVLVIVILGLFIAVAHLVGESLCNFLQDGFGIYLRPRLRRPQ